MGLCTLNVPLFYSVHCSCSLCKHSHPSIGTCGVAVTWDQACLILKATTVGSLSLPHGLIQWSLFSSHLTKYSYLPSFMKFFFCFKVQLFPDFSPLRSVFPLLCWLFPLSLPLLSCYWGICSQHASSHILGILFNQLVTTKPQASAAMECC